MADPLSLTASIIAVVTLAAQVGTSADEFVSNYRSANLDLEDVSNELKSLRRVLEEVVKAYKPSRGISLSNGGEGLANSNTATLSATTDEALLKDVVAGLNRCMEHLNEMLTRSKEQCDKGGIHKIRVQMLWQRTSKVVNKVRASLSGYKMTLMLLLEAKTLSYGASSDTIQLAVETTLKTAERLRSSAEAGEKTLDEIRIYLDDTHALPSITPQGTSETVLTFSGFNEWVASFRGDLDEDDKLIEEFRKQSFQATDSHHKKDNAEKSMMSISTDASTPKVLLIVTDLQKPGVTGPFSEQLFVDPNCEICEVLQILKDKGYSEVTGLQTKGPSMTGRVGPIYPVSSPVAVRVSTGGSCYDVSKGLRINENESLLRFYNKYIMQRRPSRAQLSMTFSLDSIDIRDTFTDKDCAISFRRTLRVPDSGAVQGLPETFGPFPLFSAAQCDPNKIPTVMREKGGLLIPMLQREALTVAFKSRDIDCRPPALANEGNCRFAARIFTGTLNAISGKPSSTLTEKSRNEQDHVVIPIQTRLDGFKEFNGQRVKQFVAMPLGSGYSVERQISPKEFGGLQLQIAPPFRKDVKFSQLAAADGVLAPPQLPLMKTPRNLRITTSHALRMWEDGKTTYVHPWDWESKSGLGKWASWLPIISKDSTNHYDRKISEYLKTVRPTYLSDLKCNAGIEQEGALVVSTVPFVSVQLRHFLNNHGVWAGSEQELGKMLFETSLQVSPFEGMWEFCRKIDVSIRQWWDEHEIIKQYGHDPRWYFKGGGNMWSLYEKWSQKTYTTYVPVHVLGIEQNSVFETVQAWSVHPAPPSHGRVDWAEETPSILSWEMALAAGNTIQQRMRADPCPEQWNWEAAELMNVQLLNTIAFESVTGLPTPSSPISFLEYSKAGIPFMNFYVDDGLTALMNTPIFPMTVGEIDGTKSVEYHTRLSPDGRLIGCVIFLGRSDYHSDIDNQCRLAVAQLLKDIQYPRHQLPDPAKTVVAAVLSEGVGNKVLRYDLLELLLSLLIDSGMDSSLSDNLLRRIVCSPFAEKLGKRLVDEGYDWRVLKRKFSRNEKRRWWYDDTVRVRLLEYSKQRLMAKPKTDTEDEIS
ncbi:hypothetical protein DPV78_004126 [Talaromyces pinophilus]|nr:hypothetical protein DPV78_004126 [Talaromyces pinophilus]